MVNPVEAGSFAYFNFIGLDNYTEKERSVIHERLCNGWSIEVKTAKEFIFVVRILPGKEWTIRFDRTLGEFVKNEDSESGEPTTEGSSYRGRRNQKDSGGVGGGKGPCDHGRGLP